MHNNVTGIVLAGGLARRMGGIDKGLVELCGLPLIQHVVNRLRPQVNSVIVNANRNLSVYGQWSDTVIADAVGDYDGPLAGMASALAASPTDLGLVVPCDSPLLCPDLASRMLTQLRHDSADIAVASDGKRAHPVFALIHATLYSSIFDFLNAGERKIDKWFEQHKLTVVDFSDQSRSFLNINTTEERDELARELCPDG